MSGDGAHDGEEKSGVVGCSTHHREGSCDSGGGGGYGGHRRHREGASLCDDAGCPSAPGHRGILGSSRWNPRTADLGSPRPMHFRPRSHSMNTAVRFDEMKRRGSREANGRLQTSASTMERGYSRRRSASFDNVSRLWEAEEEEEARCGRVGWRLREGSAMGVRGGQVRYTGFTPEIGDS